MAIESYQMNTTVETVNFLAILLNCFIFVILPLELWRRWKKSTLNWLAIKEMLASVSPLLPDLLTGTFVLAVVSACYLAAGELSPWEIPITPLSSLVCLLLVDFMYYWDHRCSHRVRGLWALYHSVHHSSPQFDQTTTFRISFVDSFFTPWFYLPIILIGFDPSIVFACFTFILSYQTWVHTESIGKLRWLDAWLNTPSNHRVHHGVQALYQDKNYGAVLIVWDRIFGTYQREEETPIFGITHPIESANPWTVHFCEIGRLWRDMLKTKGWLNRIAIWVMPPGWSPKKD